MAWPETLDAFEAHLNLVEAAIRGEAQWPGEFQPPTIGDPMPVALRRRAHGLVRRTDLLAAMLGEQMRTCSEVLERSREREATGRVVLLDLLA
ncbi:MAG: hypothetical protein M0Z91_06960 [Actinomycetota bacterium]|jgi:hypothetical protein|nr:hypothetical protein [Actinomycetota bacterium]